MEFRVLGSIEVIEDGRRLTVATGRQLAVLAFLLIHANRIVAAERIVDELWGDEPRRAVPRPWRSTSRACATPSSRGDRAASPLPKSAALGTVLTTEMQRNAYYVGCATAPEMSNKTYPALLLPGPAGLTRSDAAPETARRHQLRTRHLTRPVTPGASLSAARRSLYPRRSVAHEAQGGVAQHRRRERRPAGPRG